MEDKTRAKLTCKYIENLVEQSDKVKIKHGEKEFDVFPVSILANSGTTVASELVAQVVKAMDIDPDSRLFVEKTKAISAGVKMSMRSKTRYLKDKGLMELSEDDIKNKGRMYASKKKRKHE